MDGEGGQAGAAPVDAKPRVFLSYSRKDSDFRDRLAAALEARGYVPIYDQSSGRPDAGDDGISPTDDWWLRLQDMIAGADVMVIIVSPDSAASRPVDEEIAWARSLSKRVIGITCREVDFETAPPRLSALNVSHWFLQLDFDDAMAQLAAALDRDTDWLRRAAAYTVRAKAWRDSGWQVDKLLFGAEIAEAETWSARRPATAPEVSEVVLAYLAASRGEQAEREAREARSVRRTRWLQRWIGVAVVAGVLATLAGAWFVIDGQRKVSEQISGVLSVEARTALKARQYDRALRLAVLANRDSFLNPATPRAGVVLMEVLKQSPLELMLYPETSGLAFSTDGKRLLAGNEFSREAQQRWTLDADDKWVDRSPGRNPGADAEETEWLSRGTNAPPAWTELPVEVKGQVDGVFSKSGNTLVTLDRTRAAYIWTKGGDGKWTPFKLPGRDPRYGQEIGPAVCGGVELNKRRECIAVSPDGGKVTAIARSGEFIFWERGPDGKWEPVSIASGGSRPTISQVSFSHDGRSVLTVSDKDAFVWSWNTSVTSQDNDEFWSDTLVAGHTGAVTTAEFSPDDRQIMTTSIAEGTLRIWRFDKVAGWQSFTLYENRAAPILDAEFSPDGLRVAAASEDGVVRVWNTDWIVNERGVPFVFEKIPAKRVNLKQDAVCVARLAGNAGEKGNVRRVSAEDVVAAAILAGREGEDVCAWSPPWYDGVLRVILGWTFR